MITVSEAREKFEADLDKGKTCCPVCMRFAKIYPRCISVSMARSLIKLAQLGGSAKIRDFAIDKHVALLRFWKVIEEEEHGRWRLTPRGYRFVTGKISLPKHILIKMKECIGYEDRNNRAFIDDALGTEFNREDLMRDVAI